MDLAAYGLVGLVLLALVVAQGPAFPVLFGLQRVPLGLLGRSLRLPLGFVLRGEGHVDADDSGDVRHDDLRRGRKGSGGGRSAGGGHGGGHGDGGRFGSQQSQQHGLPPDGHRAYAGIRNERRHGGHDPLPARQLVVGGRNPGPEHRLGQPGVARRRVVGMDQTGQKPVGGVIVQGQRSHITLQIAPGSHRVTGVALECRRQPLQRPVLEHPHGTRRPIRDLGDLGHGQAGHDPQEDDLRLVGRQGGDQPVDGLLRGETAADLDRRVFGAGPSGEAVGRNRVGPPADGLPAMPDQLAAGDGEQPTPEARLLTPEATQPGSERQPHLGGEILGDRRLLGPQVPQQQGVVVPEQDVEGPSLAGLSGDEQRREVDREIHGHLGAAGRMRPRCTVRRRRPGSCPTVLFAGSFVPARLRLPGRRSGWRRSRTIPGPGLRHPVSTA